MEKGTCEKRYPGHGSFAYDYEKEMQQAGDMWTQIHLRTVISERNTMKGINIPKYDLKGV